MTKFEWDASKAKSNLEKHGVTFQEASTVFGDQLSMTFEDPDSSVGETRFLTFGVSVEGDLLVVSHTDRNDTIRLISARPMTRQERKYYEQL